MFVYACPDFLDEADVSQCLQPLFGRHQSFQEAPYRSRLAISREDHQSQYWFGRQADGCQHIYTSLSLK